MGYQKVPIWWDAADDAALRTEQIATLWPAPTPPDGVDLDEFYSRAEVTAALNELDEYVAKHVGSWTCRRCWHWRSGDGINGRCEVMAWRTAPTQMCENWRPRLRVDVEQLEMAL